MWKKWLLGILLAVAPALGLTPQQVVVVYNADSEWSKRCAGAYHKLRGVPAEQFVGLKGVKAGEIGREGFETKIRQPLLQVAREKDWNLPAARNTGIKPIYAILLMPDLPLRVRQDSLKGAPKPSIMKVNTASVDSELMLLGATYPLDGALRNTEFRKDAPLEQMQTRVLAVTRIDAPDEATMRHMISDPVEVERSGGLWGWTVVDQGGPYAQGDEWFTQVAMQARRMGQPVFHEKTKALLPAAYPLMQDVAVYFGWYHHRAKGVFHPENHAGFRFRPGAVACHLHSYNGVNIKHPEIWVGALLQRGAAVTAGNVEEPTLGLCLHYHVFFDRLLKGYTVAEAALMATPATSWQGVVLGDPLYRPYAARREAKIPSNAYTQWAEMFRRASGQRAGLVSTVRSQMGNRHAGQWLEMLGCHLLGQEFYADAAEYFGMASRASREERDVLRNRLLRISCMQKGGEPRYAREQMVACLAETRTSPFRAAVENAADKVMPERVKERQEAARRAKDAAAAAAQGAKK